MQEAVTAVAVFPLFSREVKPDLLGGGGGGTVTSVGLSLPSEFTVSGSPVTTSGTLTGVWADAAQNAVFAGPSTGGAGTPTFRALVDADMPASYDDTNWDTAYTHSQITTGNPHSIGYADISDFDTGTDAEEEEADMPAYLAM